MTSCVTSRRSCCLAMVTRAKNVTRVQELAFGHPSQDQGCPPTSTIHYSCSLKTIFLEFLGAANTLLSFMDNCLFQSTRQSELSAVSTNISCSGSAVLGSVHLPIPSKIPFMQCSQYIRRHTNKASITNDKQCKHVSLH